METLSALLARWEGNLPVTGGSPHKNQVLRVCGLINMNKLFNK